MELYIVEENVAKKNDIVSISHLGKIEYQERSQRPSDLTSIRHQQVWPLLLTL